MKYPDGTRFNRWLLSLEKKKSGTAKWYIKRWVYPPDTKPKLERLPVEDYQLIRDNEVELKRFVIRLNERDKPTRVKEIVEIRHAFISTEFLEKYKSYLQQQIPSKKQANTEYNCMYRHFLLYFTVTLGLSDPLQWHQACDDEWAAYLESPSIPKSKRSLQNIVEGANRFMTYLHKKMPAEVPPLVFKPFTKAKYKAIEAQRKLDGKVRERGNVLDEHWAIIRTKLPDSIKPFAMLSYHYGLRRAETLGVELTNVKKGYLAVEKQLNTFKDKVPGYAILKGKESRRTPHWFATAEEAYQWVEAGQKNMIHPHTLSDLWAALMKSLKLSYDFHDLRHTWVTKALRLPLVLPVDVQLAAGHKNIQTTMGYAHDDRELDDEQFTPKVG